jgi:predicted ATPase/DNA-binding CsgD family transcriptional regulator
LPAHLTDFIGRQREVADVAALLRGGVRLLTLTGPGGVGKTRLALQVAAELETDYPDGAAFVPLETVADHALVASAVAQSLGVRDSGDRPLSERLAASLRERRLLLVLDNFEHVLAAGPVLAALLTSCPSLTVLATSRAALRISGEQLFPVSPLGLPDPSGQVTAGEAGAADAVRLFVARARAVRPDFALTEENAGTVAELCRRLDGLPLAIELAAARVGVLPPRALLARLDHRLSLLVGGPQDAPARLQTLRDAIGWSYDLLSVDEQALFRRLAVFAGGCTLEAVEQLVGEASQTTGDRGVSKLGAPPSRLFTSNVSGSSVLDGIASLVGKSLVRQVQAPTHGTAVSENELREAEPRYSMLETIREYALERLAESGEEETTRAAHSRHFLALAKAAESRLIVTGSATWVERLAIERPNLRLAVDWALSHGEADAILHLAGTLLSFVYERGEPGEALAWLETALAAGCDVAPEIRVDALFTASALAQVQGDFARSIAFSEEALTMAREVGYVFGQARALCGLGITAEWQGDLERAEVLYEESLELMQIVGEAGSASGGKLERPHWIVLPMANLADVALLRHDPDRARALADEAVRRWRDAGYLWGIAQALGTAAGAASVRGDQAAAARIYEEALTQWLACDDGRGIAGTIAGIAGVALARGQLERAARLLGAAWAVGDALGVRFLAHHVHAERILAATRERLDAATFAAAWDAGRAVSLTEALEEARAALRPSGVPQTTPAAPEMLGVTPRELEVLRLLVDGRSNREIAAALYISPRTVQTHVASLFAKLGGGTRAEAAAVAVRRGIV